MIGWTYDIRIWFPDLCGWSRRGVSKLLESNLCSDLSFNSLYSERDHMFSPVIIAIPMPITKTLISLSVFTFPNVGVQI